MGKLIFENQQKCLLLWKQESLLMYSLIQFPKKHNRWPQIGQISTGVNVSGNSS